MPPAIIVSPRRVMPSRAYCTAPTSSSPKPTPSRARLCPRRKNSHQNGLFSKFSYLTGFWCFGLRGKMGFNDVRVRRAISHAMDRQGLIEAVWGRGELTPAVARGLREWSLPIDQLGTGAKYYQYNPQEARRLLAEAGFPKGFTTLLHTSGGGG